MSVRSENILSLTGLSFENKTSDEGDVGAFWGLWDKDSKLKYGK